MHFVERDWQTPMIVLGTTTERCNIFARPGMGKTTANLEIVDRLSLVEDIFPVLVVGPKRVANSVWSGDVAKFRNFQHMKVSKILGTEQQRLDALRAKADIYTIHYGLLKWLVETLGDKWPFKLVIDDESTRLKHHRCSYQRNRQSGKVFFRRAGAVNASYLAMRAHRSRRWINLTGTPAPNGLQDLWGPNWFIDFGEALGNSFDAFSRRWFVQRRGTKNEQAVFDPMPHAHDEITRRIRPYTVSLDPRDWFDIKEPRVVPVEVPLPDNLMAKYRKLHEDAVLRLSQETVITAVNAGAITNKCLQFASGNLYDKEGVHHHIHDHKLDALESLVENLGGAPLLVAYHFKPTREAILKRFPQAQLLPSDNRQKAVEDAWNEGRVPMLVVHPASAGHGLNLQYGGCDLAIVDPYWDAELYEQVIERIGPMRQMQAGLDRVVSVYQFQVPRTFDPIVFRRLRDKVAIEQSVMEATRQ